MSKVYIKGFKMPKSCADCPFKMPTFDDTEFTCKILWVRITHDEQDKSRCGICPLREVE